MNIEKLMISLDIDEDELKSHAEAHNVFSTTGSETKLKQIHPDARDRIGKFYRILRGPGFIITQESELRKPVPTSDVGKG